jgi:hypothetical protein
MSSFWILLAQGLILRNYSDKNSRPEPVACAGNFMLGHFEVPNLGEQIAIH